MNKTDDLPDSILVQQLESATSELNSVLEQSPTPEEKTRFSEDDIAILIELWEQGQTVKAIATYMERSYNNVRNKVASLQKKGVLRSRDTKLPDNFIQITAGTFSLPIDVVQYLSSQVRGNADQVISGTHMLCAAYAQQKGECFYLKGRVKLTMDNTPSGVEVVDLDGQPVLVCKAVAGMRMSLSHNTFINICKFIADNVETR